MPHDHDPDAFKDRLGKAFKEQAATERVHDVFQDAWARWEDMPPLDIHVSRVMAVTIIGALQMLARLEDTNPVMRQAAIKEGREIQRLVCDDPALYLLIESGWPDLPPNRATRRKRR